MRQVHVSPRDNGRWAVKKSNKSRASSTHRKKSAAERKGKKIAKRHNAELVVHKKNGVIQKKNSYGRDSYPPRG